MDGKYIAYYRVSTQQQGKSGLGLDAQRASVERYLNGGDWKLLAEYTEVETGTAKKVRPELARALGQCKVTGSALVVAKVDRLTRSVGFLHSLLDSGVEVRFCDLPQIEGPTGRFLLTQMVAVAELEAGLISQRTKDALQAAKARGVKLGNPNGAAALRRHGGGQRLAAERAREIADEFALSLGAVVDEVRQQAASLGQVARALNERNIRTPRGEQWHAASVARLIRRLAELRARVPT